MKTRNIFIILGIFIIFLIGIISIVYLQTRPLAMVGWDNSQGYIYAKSWCYYDDVWDDSGWYGGVEYGSKRDLVIQGKVPDEIARLEALGYSDCKMITDIHWESGDRYKPCITVVCKNCPPGMEEVFVTETPYSNLYNTGSCVPIDLCEGISCPIKCENSIRYYDGYCSDGECVYETVTCDYGCSGTLCERNPCEGVICDDKCDNSIWYHDGKCVSGKCVYDSKDTCQFGCQEEQMFLAVVGGVGMCRDDPCIGVTCDNYCIGDDKNTLATGGKCINGKCVYQENGEEPYSEECGYVPLYKNTLVWVGGITFIIVIIFSYTYYKRKLK